MFLRFVAACISSNTHIIAQLPEDNFILVRAFVLPTICYPWCLPRFPSRPIIVGSRKKNLALQNASMRNLSIHSWAHTEIEKGRKRNLYSIIIIIAIAPESTQEETSNNKTTTVPGCCARASGDLLETKESKQAFLILPSLTGVREKKYRQTIER